MSLPLIKRFLLHSLQYSTGVFRTAGLVSEELLDVVNSYAVNRAKMKEISDTKLGRELNVLMKEDCGVTKGRQAKGDRRVF